MSVNPVKLEHYSECDQPEHDPRQPTGRFLWREVRTKESSAGVQCHGRP